MDFLKEKNYLLAINKSLEELGVSDLGDLNITCDYMVRSNPALSEFFTILLHYSTEKLWEKKKIERKPEKSLSEALDELKVKKEEPKQEQVENDKKEGQ